MKHLIKCSAALYAIASAMSAGAQNSSIQTQGAASGTIAAYVYVSTSPSSGVSQINAYSASSNGKLAAVAGSPFNFGSENLTQMAVNSKFLFASSNFTDIYSISIASNGALQQVSQIDASTYNPYQSGGPAEVFLDHTGTILYDLDYDAYGTGGNAYQAFSMDGSTGQLNFLQLGPNGGLLQNSVLSFIGSNVFAYGAGCYEGSGGIYGYQRNSNGTLTQLSITPSIPVAPKSEGQYCPYLAAADPNNNVAITMEPNNDISPSGPVQIAVYTADSDGNLTTQSTAHNMPTTQAGPTYGINDMWMSPSGKLLAVGGTSGLQVFHFNGANPVTPYTGMLTGTEIDQLFWDNVNHLYALSRTAGKLYVFTVTPTEHVQASGSPYSIPGAQALQVLPE